NVPENGEVVSPLQHAHLRSTKRNDRATNTPIIETRGQPSPVGNVKCRGPQGRRFHRVVILDVRRRQLSLGELNASGSAPDLEHALHLERGRDGHVLMERGSGLLIDFNSHDNRWLPVSYYTSAR